MDCIDEVYVIIVLGKWGEFWIWGRFVWWENELLDGLENFVEVLFVRIAKIDLVVVKLLEVEAKEDGWKCEGEFCKEGGEEISEIGGERGGLEVYIWGIRW